jgi:hypothetical protein
MRLLQLAPLRSLQVLRKFLKTALSYSSAFKPVTAVNLLAKPEYEMLYPQTGTSKPIIHSDSLSNAALVNHSIS